MFWNGPVIGYEVTVKQIVTQGSLSTMHGHLRKRTIFIDQPEYRHKRLIEPVIKNVSGLSVSTPSMTLKMNEDYVVEVTFINSEGMSKESSELRIPHWNQSNVYTDI